MLMGLSPPWLVFYILLGLCLTLFIINLVLVADLWPQLQQLLSPALISKSFHE